MFTIHNGTPNVFKEFSKNFAIELETAFNKYYRLADQHWGKGEPAFFYTEQRTKTFFTIALSNLSNGLVLQEVATERKEKKNAKIDYYFRFHKSDFAMEVKQSWLRFTPEFNRAALGGIAKGQSSAIKQVKELRSSQWVYDYALAVTFTPVFIIYKKRPTAQEIVKCNEHAEGFFDRAYREKLTKNLKCHALGTIPFSYLNEKCFDTGENGYQSYPFGILTMTCFS